MVFDKVKDDSIFITPEQDFVIQCNCVFDSIITQMQWRLEATSRVSSDFLFLTGKQISLSSVEELQQNALNLPQKYQNDLNSFELQAEIESFKFHAKSISQ